MQLRIDTNRNALNLVVTTGNCFNACQLFPRLHIDALNVRLDGQCNLLQCLATAGEDDLAGVDTGGEATGYFTSGNDVKTASQFVEKIKYTQIWVRLYRITEHKVLDVLQRTKVEIVVVHQTVRIVHVQRCACTKKVTTCILLTCFHGLYALNNPSGLLPYSSAISFRTIPPRVKVKEWKIVKAFIVHRWTLLESQTYQL